jgi:hypothetical protein
MNPVHKPIIADAGAGENGKTGGPLPAFAASIVKRHTLTPQPNRAVSDGCSTC